MIGAFQMCDCAASIASTSAMNSSIDRVPNDAPQNVALKIANVDLTRAVRAALASDVVDDSRDG